MGMIGITIKIGLRALSRGFLLGLPHDFVITTSTPHPFYRGMRLSTSEGHFTIEAETIEVVHPRITHSPSKKKYQY